jgi:hypothetical protein
MTLAVPIGAIFPIVAIADVAVAVVIPRRSNTSDERANTHPRRRLDRPRRPARRRRRLTMDARIIDRSIVALERSIRDRAASIDRSIDRSDGIDRIESIDRSDGIDRSISRSHDTRNRSILRARARTIAVDGERDTRSSRDRSMSTYT